MAEWKTAGKVRMTPKGVHDSTIAYNILDLVSNEDHTMYYIAKQDVPANTLLTNTDYWDVITDVSEIPDQISEIEDDVTELKSAISEIEPGLSEAAKVALLNCFDHVAWIDEHGQTYYDALEAALYANQYPKITAVFDPGVNVIYTDDSLNSLKQYLTVKYYETRDSAGTTIAASNYTLSGTLAEGTSTILVSYNNLMASVAITGVVDFYNIWEWSTEYSGAGKLNGGGPVMDRTKDGVRLGFETNNNPKRFGISVNKGKQLVVVHETGQDSDLYPVPIPKTATKVTITVTPSTDYLFGYIGRYEAGSRSDRYDYVMINELASWTYQGTYSCNFSAGENLFLGYNGKKSDNSNYTDTEKAARVVTVVFE